MTFQGWGHSLTRIYAQPYTYIRSALHVYTLSLVRIFAQPHTYIRLALYVYTLSPTRIYAQPCTFGPTGIFAKILSMNFSPASTFRLKIPPIKLTYKTLHQWRLFILPPLSFHYLKS